MTILDQIYESVVNGDAPKVKELTRQALDDSIAASVILHDGLMTAMD